MIQSSTQDRTPEIVSSVPGGFDKTQDYLAQAKCLRLLREVIKIDPLSELYGRVMEATAERHRAIHGGPWIAKNGKEYIYPGGISQGGCTTVAGVKKLLRIPEKKLTKKCIDD